MLAYLSKNFQFSYTAIQPKGAFGGLMDMASIKTKQTATAQLLTESDTEQLSIIILVYTTDTIE